MIHSNILLLVIGSFLLGGCSNKQPKPNVQYIYKTKVQYVYLPCKKEDVLNKKTIVNEKKAKPKVVAKKKFKKYIQPKPTKIYAPKKYTKRPNKKMDFMLGINSDGSEFIYMEGEFGRNTYKNFSNFLKKTDSRVKEIKINSNGGLVSTAMQIGSYVYEQGWSTGVDKEMHCLSACSFVYFAGKAKSLEGGAFVGLHRPYRPGVADTRRSIQKTKHEYISYWNYIQAPKSVYDEMMEVNRDNLFILNKKNINEYIDVKIK